MPRIFWNLKWREGIVARVGWCQIFDGNGNPYSLCCPYEGTARGYVERLWSINSPYRPSAWLRTADGFLLIASGAGS